MRVVIADDEAPARGELRALLDELDGAEVVGEAATGRAALERIRADAPDLVFLDIQMPGGTGLDVASQVLELPKPPLVVFVTAYDEHALKAFDLAAVDYLLKPIDPARLARAVARAKGLLGSRAEAERRAQAALDASSGPLRRVLAARPGEKPRVVLDVSRVLWFQADGKRSIATTAEGEYEVPRLLGDLEEAIGAGPFLRTHKGYLVNLDHVAEVVPWFAGALRLKMTGRPKSEVPVSRRFAKGLRKHLGRR